MVKIQVNKKQKLVIFKCKTEEEMAWTLELYQKGAEIHREKVITALNSQEPTKGKKNGNS